MADICRLAAVDLPSGPLSVRPNKHASTPDTFAFAQPFVFNDFLVGTLLAMSSLSSSERILGRQTRRSSNAFRQSAETWISGFDGTGSAGTGGIDYAGFVGGSKARIPIATDSQRLQIEP
jgi:hypothetical protein